jgi:hypothetical protein
MKRVGEERDEEEGDVDVRSLTSIIRDMGCYVTQSRCRLKRAAKKILRDS